MPLHILRESCLALLFLNVKKQLFFIKCKQKYMISEKVPLGIAVGIDLVLMGLTGESNNP